MHLNKARLFSTVGAPTRRIALPPIWLLSGIAVAFLLIVDGKDALDVLEYHCYAVAFWSGGHAASTLSSADCLSLIPDLALAPFHQLPREYGPLSLVLFSLPLLAPDAWYTTTFLALMCGVVLGITWLLWRYGPRGAAHAWILYVLLGNMSIVATRFDVAASACALLAILAVRQGHRTWAYGALAAGFLLKFFPLALLPLFLIDSWRERKRAPFWRGPTLFAGLVAGVEALANVASPGSMLNPLHFMADRCVEVESFPATIGLVLAHITGARYNMSYSATYKSSCVFSPTLPLAEIASTVGALSLAGIVIWFYWRERYSLTKAAFFLIMAAIIGSKVFSLQYLLWLGPLVALEYGLSGVAFAGWGAVCLATACYYPVAFNSNVVKYAHTTSSDIPIIVAVRNALLTVVISVAAWRGAHPPAERTPVELPVSVEVGAS